MYPYEQEMTPKQEMEALRDQAEVLKKQLEEIQGRISTLGKVQDEKK
jgi:prefoldin subunit 5